MADLPSNSYADIADPRNPALSGDVLAVAYELRTANLIAALTAANMDGSATFPAERDTLRGDILARLGYGEGWASEPNHGETTPEVEHLTLLLGALFSLGLGGDHLTIDPDTMTEAKGRALTVWTDDDGNTCLRSDDRPAHSL